jgi:hypothetical protein
MRRNNVRSISSFLIVFFVLTITFCLVSAGIFKANTSIGMAAYATTSEGSSGGDKSDKGGGSKGGGDSSGGSDGGGSSDEGGGESSGSSNDNGGSDSGDKSGSSSGSSGGEGGDTGVGGSGDKGGENGPSIPEPGTPPPCPDGSSDCNTPPPPPPCPEGSSDCGTPPPPPPPPPPCDPATDSSCPPPPPPPPPPCDPAKEDCTPPCPPGSTDCTPPCDPAKEDCTPPCPPVATGLSCPPPPPPPPPPCKDGEHYDTKLKKCIPDKCPEGTERVDGECQQIIRLRLVIHTVVKNSFTTNQPKFLLLLDTAQLCQLAGDTQCVAKQNQFDTLNLVTKLDSTGKTWTITGQVENRVSKTQNNVQVVAYFYDSKGNSVGGPYKGIVNPTVLKSLQLGAFSMKPSTSIMKGTPTFLRLEYQSTSPRP